MSEIEQNREKMMKLAAEDIELLFQIIGDLGFSGYKVALCRLKGNSLKQCAIKNRISKSLAQYMWDTCREKGRDAELKKLFDL